MTYYLETGSHDPYYNLAFEETVLLRRTQGEYLILWQNESTVVVGRNQNTAEEVDQAFVAKHHIHVVRRGTGGGAVYHDLGNLNYSFISDAGDAEKLTMERFTRPVVSALRGLGLDAEASGRNDILVEGRKVSGTAQRLLGGRILHHGCLLFDADPAMLAGALRADPEKFASKSTKSVRSRVANVRDFLKQDMTLTQFWQYLKTTMAADGLTETTLSTEELASVEALRRDKYDTWQWNWGSSPKYTMKNRRRFPGGTLEVRADVGKGVITKIVFYGDFLSISPLEELCTALEGCPFRREELQAVLDRFPVRELFGEVTADEVLDTVLALPGTSY